MSSGARGVFRLLPASRSPQEKPQACSGPPPAFAPRQVASGFFSRETRSHEGSRGIGCLVTHSTWRGGRVISTSGMAFSVSAHLGPPIGVISTCGGHFLGPGPQEGHITLDPILMFIVGGSP